MGTTVKSDPLAFATLNSFIEPYQASGRTDSAALLIWFLETIYRLDSTEAQDAVCDKRGDLGIDALDVRDDQNEIVLFQAKRKEKLPGTLGDSDLKNFVGALHQFDSEASVKKIVATTTNSDLKRLLIEQDVANKISKGYSLRPIFVCNIAANNDAAKYIVHAESSGFDIDLWDLGRLEPVLKQLSKEWFVDSPVSLKLNSSKLFLEGKKSAPTLVYAAVSAKELVKLPGIADTRIFAQNVRLGLGSTRVNKEILETIRKTSEHKTFLTFHNGLTIVAKDIKISSGGLQLNNYSVCNGCQSLSAFYENRSELTNGLEVLVRIVKVGNDRRLPELIAYRTNNQNAITLRDLSANDASQVRLKAEFDGLFGDLATYVIKQGETSPTPALMNEQAGRMLMSLYVREPWSAHQKYKIFGELESSIFGYGRNAYHIWLSQLIMKSVEDRLSTITHERVRKYTLTRFVALYLVGEILREEDAGSKLLNDPSPYLSTLKNKTTKEKKVLQSIEEQVEFVLTEVNFFIDDHGGDTFDYKSEFKSPTSVKRLRSEVMKAYIKDKRMGRINAFSLPR
jgi:AIPR protein